MGPKNWRRSFLDRRVGGRRRTGAGRGVARQQDQKDLRADADPGAEKTSQAVFAGAEEKRGGGKIADAKTIGYSREISVAFSFKEKESLHSCRKCGAERIRFAEEKEEIFSDAGSGLFTERFSQEEKEAFADTRPGFFAEPFSEEEAQVFVVANTNPGGISRTFAEPDRDTGSGRNAQRHAVTFAQEKRSAGHDRDPRHIRL